MAKKDAKEAEVIKPAKKSTTKSVKKDAVNTKEIAADLRKLTEAELQKALKTAREDLLTAQKMLHANELPATHVIRKMKKQIARIHAVLAEKVSANSNEDSHDNSVNEEKK